MTPVLAAAALAVLAPPAAAQRAALVQTFTAPGLFYAAALNLSTRPAATEGFDDGGADALLPTGTTRGALIPVTFAFPDGTSGRFDSHYLHRGLRGLALHDDLDPDGGADYFLPAEGVTLTFGAPVTALGVWVGLAASPAGSVGIETLVGTAGNAAGTGPWFFVGLLSDTPFTSAWVGGLSGAAGGGFVLDELTVAGVPLPLSAAPDPTTATPEPATFALCAGGLLALGALARRRTVPRRAVPV